MQRSLPLPTITCVSAEAPASFIILTSEVRKPRQAERQDRAQSYPGDEHHQSLSELHAYWDSCKHLSHSEPGLINLTPGRELLF